MVSFCGFTKSLSALVVLNYIESSFKFSQIVSAQYSIRKCSFLYSRDVENGKTLWRPPWTSTACLSGGRRAKRLHGCFRNSNRVLKNQIDRDALLANLDAVASDNAVSLVRLKTL